TRSRCKAAGRYRARGASDCIPREELAVPPLAGPRVVAADEPCRQQVQQPAAEFGVGIVKTVVELVRVRFVVEKLARNAARCPGILTEHERVAAGVDALAVAREERRGGGAVGAAVVALFVEVGEGASPVAL